MKNKEEWLDSNGNPFKVNNIYRYGGSTWILKKITNRRRGVGLFQKCHSETLKPLDRTIDFLFTSSFEQVGIYSANNKGASGLLSKEW